MAGQRRGWGKARQQWHFYLGLLGSERVGGGGGGRRLGHGGGDGLQHLATHLLLLNPVRAERWVSGGRLTRSRDWGDTSLGPLARLGDLQEQDQKGSQWRQNSRCARMCPWLPVGRSSLEGQIGVALVREATTTCRPMAIPGSRLSGGLAAARVLPGNRAGRAASFQARRCR